MDEAIIEEAVMRLIVETVALHFHAPAVFRAAALIASRRRLSMRTIAGVFECSQSGAVAYASRGRELLAGSGAYEREIAVIEDEIEAALLSAIGGAFSRAEAA